jgi:two-component system, response regulator YesN
LWKIALIDDDRQVLQGMKNSIPWEELNAEWVGEAMNGVDGLELIQKTQPDVVITDIYMPLLDGLDMVEQLRGNQFSGKVIVLSGYSDFEYARKSLRLNVHDYLSKPVSLPTLKTVLSKALGEIEKEFSQKVKQEELEHKLMMYEPFFEQEWVKSAITGTLKETFQGRAKLPSSYLYWEKCHHIVLAIELVRESRPNTQSLTDWNLFRFAVKNIMTEITHEEVPFYEYVELHSTRVALILHEEADKISSSLMHQVKSLCVRLADSILEYLKLKVRIGIGSLKTDWTSIPDSTEEAFRAIDLKRQWLLQGYELYLDRDEAHDESASILKMRPVKFYQELAATIKSINEPQAHVIIDEYMDILKKNKLVSPNYLQMLAGELWGIFAYCLYEVGMVLDDLFPDIDISTEIARLSKSEELSNWLKDKISVICESRLWRGNSRHRRAVDFMIQYIHEHYADDITLGDLADKVYISKNYLSVIFKNITGDTFNNYLTKVRIEKAKEMLLEPNTLVYEVSEKVGYKNVPYFSTIFKKYTGMNPTDYVK